MFHRFHVIVLWVGVLVFWGDCRCAEEAPPQADEKPDKLSSAEGRAGDLYVSLACMSQEDLSPEDRLKNKRALFLEHKLTDPEYVQHVRRLLADTGRSEALADRIRKTCRRKIQRD